MFRGHFGAVTRVAWSPDGRWIASASADKKARLWQAVDPVRPRVLPGHEPAAWWAEWSPDGERVCSTSTDKTLRVWNADGSGAPVVLRGHMAVAGTNGRQVWSPDGRLLLSHSDDGTLRIWDLESRSEWLVLRNPSSSVGFNSASWSPDGRSVLAASVDGNVWIWDEVSPIRTTDDPRLWLATTYCPSIEERQRLLNVTEDTARADLERCERRAREAWGHAAAER